MGVIFHFKGKVYKVGDKAHVFHRQFAKISELKEEGGVHTCVLEDFAEACFKTVAEWSDKVKAAAAVAGEAAMEVADAMEKKDQWNENDDGPTGRMKLIFQGCSAIYLRIHQ